MKFVAKLSANTLSRRFARLQDEIEEAALDAAADALAGEIARVREREDLHAPLMRGATERGRSISVNDRESVERELGTLDRPSSPWLAPSLPLALARMRREAAAHAGNRRTPMRAAAIKAVARALSRMKRR